MKRFRILPKSSLSIGILVISFLAGLFTQCGKNSEGPPGDVIAEAKTKTEFIINKVKMSDETITGTPELVKEYWEAEEQRYVLEYYVETVFGAAVTDSPTAYIVKESGGWKYQFSFDKPYESPL